MYCNEILNIISTGIVIIDRQYKVIEWNRWMSFFSKIEREQIVNCSLFQFFPGLNEPGFIRTCKSVLSFGNIVFLSQKIHNNLFPFKVVGSHSSRFEFMQQSCSIAPLRNKQEEIEHLIISIQDVTESVVVEQKLRTLNSLDELTGVYNRRFLNLRLNEEFYRLIRYKIKLSLIMFDIDHFKQLNDNSGHQCGDYVLQHLCEVISALIRDVDLLARYGGDEFTCLLPETDISGAEFLAERIRMLVNKTEFIYEEKKLEVSVSLGVAQSNEEMTDSDQLLEAADTALYKAKKAGRNCVSIWSSEH